MSPAEAYMLGTNTIEENDDDGDDDDNISSGKMRPREHASLKIDWRFHDSIQVKRCIGSWQFERMTRKPNLLTYK